MTNQEMIQAQYGMDNVGYPAGQQQYVAAKSVSMRKRIKKAQGKAKWMGFFYFIGTLALLAAACLGMFEYKTADGKTEYLWVLNFWKPFLDIKDGFTWAIIKPMIKPLLYGLMLLVLLINVFRCFGKFGWLYKKKASRKYGFNRNAFAMEDLGRIFSGSFFALIFWGCILYLTGYDLTIVAYAAVGVGFFFHFWCGIVGGNVSLFTAQGGVQEEKRIYGRFSPFLRNLLQIAAVAGIAWFFLEMNTLKDYVGDIVKHHDFKALLDDMNSLIVAAIELLIVICWLVLVKHTTASTEFDRDGSYAAGAHNFRIFTFFIFLLAGGLVAFEYFVMSVAFKNNMETIWIAAIAFGSFIIECIMHRFPKVKRSIRKQEMADAEYNADEVARVSKVPLHCFNAPGLVNYGGQEFMFMPMTSNAPTQAEEAQVEYYFVD